MGLFGIMKVICKLYKTKPPLESIGSPLQRKLKLMVHYCKYLASLGYLACSDASCMI